ncbi:sulfite exporter TauE/SafE family protein [Lactococcus muris]|uniref:Probable membrane transporter protein n=1 Tax=Lactococcus muris TaxID=2941330 RepID=A0ABV4D8V7_9LACT|nr:MULTISPECIES: sulfite exporter TauE/SafE family protein [Lactococcus]MBL3715702.1 TSUP family transporter [Lactococcus garvieae]
MDILQFLLYPFIIIIANVIGAISGMGGGLIIKPLLSLLGFHSLPEIVFYSSVAVLVMALSSTARQIKNGIKINGRNVIFLSIGSVLGGMLGQQVLQFSFNIIGNEKTGQLQAILLIILLSGVLLLGRLNLHLNKQLTILYFLCGLSLGTASVFLGIGGGPFNVALLLLIFPLKIKEATTYSIVSILFSQVSNLVTTLMLSNIFEFDLNILLVIIPAAFIGGNLGALLSGKLSDRSIGRLFDIVVIMVIFITLIPIIF